MNIDDQQHLKELIFLSCELAEVNDFDVLMDKILKSAREFVHSDAGSIYIKKDRDLVFSYTQNDTLQKNLESGRKLVYTTHTIPINNNSLAGYAAVTGKTLNIQDAYALSANLPFHFDKSYDVLSQYHTHSILTVPLKTSSGDIVGILQLINALDTDGKMVPFREEVEPYVDYFANCAANALERAILTRTILLRLIKMTELRDPNETGDHVRRVAGISLEIYEKWAKKRGIPQRDILHNTDILHMGAMLHDVGKTAISDIILKKPEKLSPAEFENLKKHTIYGAQLFSNPTSEYEKAAQIVALNHHEWYDGTGYPGHVDPLTGKPLEGYMDKRGKPLPKKGEEIPIFGRVVALADVYDALFFPRAYKSAWDHDKVLATICKEKNTHFDPDIVEAFFESLPSIRNIAERFS